MIPPLTLYLPIVLAARVLSKPSLHFTNLTFFITRLDILLGSFPVHAAIRTLRTEVDAEQLPGGCLTFGLAWMPPALTKPVSLTAFLLVPGPYS